MNKFIKSCIIAGVVCVLAGGGITAAAVAMGGTVIDTIPLRLKQWGFELGQIAEEDFWNNSDFSFEDGEFNNDDLLLGEQTIHTTGQGSQIYSATGIKNLRADIKAGGLRIVEDSQGDEITIFCNKDESFYEIEENEGELILQTHSKKANYKNPKLLFTIHVPKDYKFTSVDIQVEPERVRYENEDSSVYLVADGLIADECNLDIKAGTAKIRKANIDTLNIYSEAGAVNYSGSVLNQISLNCEASAVKFQLEGKKEDFSYDVSASLGAVKLENKSLFAFDKTITQNPDAQKSIILNCEVSAVQITFKNQES